MAGLASSIVGLLDWLADLMMDDIVWDYSSPAFVIFSDKTLAQMAEELPITENQFLAINGVGSKKLEEFYCRFCEVIEKFKVPKPQDSPRSL